MAAVFPPIVGKTIDDCAGKTRAEGIFDLPLEDFTFSRFAFAKGIDAEFAENERFGIGEHLKASEIISERLPVMQIDVETHEISAARAKKFGWRKTGESVKAIGVGAFGDGN